MGIYSCIHVGIGLDVAQREMAYAAANSLSHTIERLKNLTKKQIITKKIQSLLTSADEEVESLRGILKRLDDSSNRSVINALDAKIREAVCEVEDVAESYVLYHSLPRSRQLQIDPVNKSELEQQIHSFFGKVKKLKEEYIRELDSPSPEDEEEEEDDDLRRNRDITVGLSDQLEKVRKELQDWISGPKNVSLLGMAGIGKTHLARELLQDFNLTALVKIGQKNSMENILVDILAQIEHKPRDEYMGKNTFALTMRLQRRLKDQRYLIVLDDVWDTRFYNTLRWWLPTNENGRRLLLTTRLERVAEYHSKTIHKMSFLNKDESWDLLRQNVFVESPLPPELEKVGKKIAENCEGLPLFILTVADILGGLEKTQEYWNKVALKKTTTFSDAYDKISKVLLRSYEHLPQHLKAFFLYLGVFPQSCEIRVSKLINLLEVEDFLESNQLENLEYYAPQCMKELDSNSVVMICKQSYNYIIKSSKLHSVYWHLCAKEASRNKFFLVLNKLTDGSIDNMESQRRFSVQNNVLFGIKDMYDSIAATLTTRSLLCTGNDQEYPVPICSTLLFLKVLDALTLRFYEFPTEVLRLVMLRYLALTHYGKIPSSISNLRQLQSLTVRQHHNIKFLQDSTSYAKKILGFQGLRRVELPNEIWDMQELKHLRMKGSRLPYPNYRTKLSNLVTLYANDDSCSEAVFKRIPYLEKLVIEIELLPDAAETLNCFQHIRRLEKLHSLKCVVVNPRINSRVVAPPAHLSNLPKHLRKLSLKGLGYSWKLMSVIGSLPDLKVLKLGCSAFRGAEWETEVEHFQSLEFLLLEDVDLEVWTCKKDDCFPRLKRLTISHCYKLKKIPLQMSENSNLKAIELVDCSPSVVASAQKLRMGGIFSLQLIITNS